jgi:hypothetical protein
LDLTAWRTQRETIYQHHLDAGRYPEDALLALSYPGNWAGDKFNLHDADGIERALTRRAAQGKDLYFRVSPMANRTYGPKERGGAVDGLGLPCLFGDFDTEDGEHAEFRGEAAGYRHPNTAEVLDMIQSVMPASLIIKSGGGLHAYWSTSSLISLQLNERGKIDTTSRQAVLLENFDAMWVAESRKRGFSMDQGIAKDTARVLRVAGSSNYKTDPPKPVEVLVNNPSVRYDHPWLFRNIPEAPKAAPSKARTLRGGGASVARIGDRRTGMKWAKAVPVSYLMEGVWGMFTHDGDAEDREWFFPFEDDGGKARHAKTITGEASGAEFVVAYDTRLQEEWGVGGFNEALTSWDLLGLILDGNLSMARFIAATFPEPCQDLLDTLVAANAARFENELLAA